MEWFRSRDETILEIPQTIIRKSTTKPSRTKQTRFEVATTTNDTVFFSIQRLDSIEMADQAVSIFQL